MFPQHLPASAHCLLRQCVLGPVWPPSTLLTRRRMLSMTNRFLFLLNECPALLSIQTRDMAPVWSLVVPKGSDRHGTIVTCCQFLRQPGKSPTSGEGLGPQGPGRYCSCGQKLGCYQSTYLSNTYCFKVSICICFLLSFKNEIDLQGGHRMCFWKPPLFRMMFIPLGLSVPSRLCFSNK